MTARKCFLFIFSLGFGFLAQGQEFRYLKSDTISPRLVYLKLKGEEKWSDTMLGEWQWRNESQLTRYIEEHIFKEAFQNVDWKHIPDLQTIGVFFRFDKTFHMDYVHFIIRRNSFTHEDLLLLEKNLVEYVRLLKQVDLGAYVYTDDPAKFEHGIGRFWLIREKSSVWNEK